jgi:hypothetical protein
VFRVAPFALLLLLAACSRGADQSDRAETSAPAAGATHESTVATTPAAAPGTTLPAPGNAPRYVGRWASRADLCEGGAWTFTREGAALEDGPTCRFDSVSDIPGGSRIAATCEQDGKRRQGTATLRIAESARAMLVESHATLPDTGLVYCGPAPANL